MQRTPDDGSRRVKNIAAILYVLVMIFLVGGSYVHQQTYEKSVEQVPEQADQLIKVHQ